jgi:hypothetical protein
MMATLSGRVYGTLVLILEVYTKTRESQEYKIGTTDMPTLASEEAISDQKKKILPGILMKPREFLYTMKNFLILA